MTRDQMLANLHASLASSRPWLKGVARSASQDIPPYVHPPAADLAAQFADQLRALAGQVYPVLDESAALAQIGALLRAKAATQAIAWDLGQIGLPGLAQLLAEHGVALVQPAIQNSARKGRLQALDPATICISGADLGIAESGSLLLRHSPGRPRIASLLAPYHIAVLRTSQLVRGLGEALALVRARYGGAIFTATSNLTLITGPSRTADIEMTLSLGIHGPQEIHVVLIADSR
ncbi:MAG: LUD domain-containing protein [Oscillochloris sp.]|nr:LUD domain-containing protein [Oscillochloris sp.]